MNWMLDSVQFWKDVLNCKVNEVCGYLKIRLALQHSLFFVYIVATLSNIWVSGLENQSWNELLNTLFFAFWKVALNCEVDSVCDDLKIRLVLWHNLFFTHVVATSVNVWISCPVDQSWYELNVWFYASLREALNGDVDEIDGMTSIGSILFA